MQFLTILLGVEINRTSLQHKALSFLPSVGCDVLQNKTIAYNVNEVIVSNIRSLIMSLNKFGVHDRETIRFKENIALAVSGNISSQKLEDATSLSRRVLLHGREMRTIFDCETTKAIAENHTGQNVNENVDDDCNDNEDSEADTVNGSDDDGDNSDNSDNDIVIRGGYG